MTVRMRLSHEKEMFIFIFIYTLLIIKGIVFLYVPILHTILTLVNIKLFVCVSNS